MTTPMRFKTLPFRQLESFKIDREANIIRGVTAMVGGVEALGHGAMTDMKSIAIAAALAQNSKRQIRTRFGHPGASENSAGRTLAVARNFSVVGNKLVHDLHFMSAASKSPAFPRDPLPYIFDMAEHNPEELAESVVMYAERVWTMNDGSEVNVEDGEALSKLDKEPVTGRPLNALTTLPVFRPTSLSHVDIVAEGALTHGGLFSAEGESIMHDLFEGTGNEAAEDIFEALDYWRDQLNLPLSIIPQKATWLAQRYLAARGYREDETMAKKMLNLETAVIDDGLTNNISSARVIEPDEKLKSASVADALALAKETEAALAVAPEIDPVVHLSEMVTTLSAQLYETRAELDEVRQLAEINARNNRTLELRQRQLDAEPYVTLNVPAIPPARSLAPLEMLSPEPPMSAGQGNIRLQASRANAAQPVQRMAPVKEADAEAQAVMAYTQARRQRGQISS